MRIMGLDVGTKTIGVAVSDLMMWTAQGVTTIKRTSIVNDLKLLGDIIKQYEVTDVLIGFPLNMDGSESESCERARFLGEKIEEEFSIKPVYWDERLSTVGAARVLLEADISRKKRKDVIDKQAAVFILQGYLDSGKYRKQN